MSATVRTARHEDDAALRNVDALTWSTDTTPAPPPGSDSAFFVRNRNPEDVLVAVVGGEVVGFVMLAAAHPLEPSRHVLEINGLAVHPAHARRAIGRTLMIAAIGEATARGARRLTLRVLGSNTRARKLYESCGFEIEGVLRGEFLLDGRYVDDVLMALALTRHPIGRSDNLPATQDNRARGPRGSGGQT